MGIDATWTWRQLTPVTSPDLRAGHGMAWDGSRVLLFGGFGSGTFYDDTWELVGDEWNQLTPSTTPTERTATRMLWDGSRILMYGGTSSSFVDLNDLWEYTSSDWNQLFPANSPPEYNPPVQPGLTVSTIASQFVWDGTRGLVLYPIYDPVNGTFLWQYASGNWSRVNPTNEYGVTATPSSSRDRWYMPLVWAGDRLVSGGGAWNTQQSFADTEEYDDTTWTETVVDGATGWLHRSAMKMVWTGDEVFMFGGLIASVGSLGEPVSNESWSYDTTTSTWTDLTYVIGGTPPSARQEYDMVWDGTRIILFGGMADGLVRNNETWVLEPPPTPPPPAPVPEYHTLSRRVNYRGQWDTGIAYDVGDAVTHNRETFLCIQANTAQEPDDT